jgi:threonine/homoserine/homoserine lactone efflux protein
MNDYLFLIPIALALIIGVMSPGPSFIFVAQTAMDKSRAHGIATSLGMGVGVVVFTLLAIFGLFIVLETVPWLYMGLKFIGGLYLCYLAYKIWQSSSEKITTSSSNIEVKGDTRSYYKSFMLGLITQLTNPKTAIVTGGVFMAFLPAEIPEYSYLILAVMSFVIDAGWYSIVSIALTTSRAQKVYIRFKKSISRLASGLMAAMGVKLIFNQ